MTPPEEIGANFDEDGFRIVEIRCELPCGCVRFGSSPGCAEMTRCDTHHDFQEAVNTELSARAASMQEASSILYSVKVQLEKRKDLTVVERELISTMNDWLHLHPVPGIDA